MSAAALPTTFTDRALRPVHKWKFSIIPCDVRGKGPYGLNAGKPRWGITSKTNTEEGVRAFAALVPAEANYGICSDDIYTILETDDRERFTALLSRPLPDTYCVSARKNRGYMVFKQTAKTRAVRGLPEVPGLFEWRQHGYCVGPGSVHPDTGTEYRLVRDIEPVEMPDWLVDELLVLHKNAPASVRNGETGEGEVDTDALSALLDALHKRGEPEDMLGLEGVVISSLHPTLKPLIAHLYQGPETSDEVADIVRRVGEAYGHRQPQEKDVEDVIEWLNGHNCKPCFCKDCDDATEANLPPSFFWPSPTEWQQTGPLWIFSKEADFALFKHRVEQTPAWAYAAEQKEPDGLWELPTDYEAWRASQGNKEDPRLLTHAALKAVRNATPSPEIVEGTISENSVNILVGDSGLGKTPFVVQLAVCIALGADFLGQKTVQKKVMMVDYENAEALADVVGQICEHLKLPADFVMDPKWFRIVQNVDASEVLKLVQEFKPDFVVVDSLRGFCPTADTKNETASKLITELQSRKASFLLMHHVRKNSTEKRDKRQPLEKEERVLDWLEAAAGARALINQTYTRIAIDHIKADNADLVVRGFYKGRGEFGPWKLARNYSEQHGEPIGYDRLTGTALLDVEQNAFFDAIPKGRSMSYKEIQRALGQSEGQITRFLAACDNARVVETSGKRKTRSRRYTFLAEKKAPKSAEELEQEESVREAFK